jgi:hypothetical protein
VTRSLPMGQLTSGDLARWCAANLTGTRRLVDEKASMRAQPITNADNPARNPLGRWAVQLTVEGCSQPSCTDSVRAVLIRTLTCCEESPARHSTDHG